MQIQFPLILDGATGTELQKRGFTGDVCAEEWVLAHPEAIADIQRGYVQTAKSWRSTGSSTKPQTITAAWRSSHKRRQRAGP